MTSKRMLIVASDRSLADSIRTHAERVGIACEVAIGANDAIGAIRTRKPDVVVVCDHPSCRSLPTCDILVPIAREVSVPVLAVTLDDVSDHDMNLHRAGPNRAAQYVRWREGAAEIVRIAALFVRRAMPPIPPPPPRATRRNDALPVSVATGPRPEMRSGGAEVATARAVALDREPTVAANDPARSESGVHVAVRPEASPRAVEPKVSALALEAARRESAEATRVRHALERRASEAEQRALVAEQLATTNARREAAAREALERALQAHEESETAWSERVASAERLAESALNDRDEVRRSLAETQRVLEGTRGEIATARTTIDRERTRASQLARERDDARSEVERSKREVQQFAARVETLERGLDRDRRISAQLDRANARLVAMDAELESVRAERDAAQARFEAHRREVDDARARGDAAAAGASATREEESASSARRELDTLRAEVAALQAATTGAAEIAAHLERAKRVIRHLLDVHQKRRVAKGSDEATQAMMRLFNRIIETQERRITVLESIVDLSHPASAALVAESRRLEKELQILHAQVDRAATARH